MHPMHPRQNTWMPRPHQVLQCCQGNPNVNQTQVEPPQKQLNHGWSITHTQTEKKQMKMPELRDHNKSSTPQ
jgi:hypothetical protein